MTQMIQSSINPQSAKTIIRLFRFLACMAACGWVMGIGTAVSADSNQVLQISAITIPGKKFDPPYDKQLNLGPFPEETVFYFGASSNADHTPLRLRCRLEGYEEEWHEGGPEMYLIVRFYNESGDNIDQVKYTVRGTSPGWTGNLRNSPLTHRRETVTVPPNAARVMVVLSSAGPPATIGVYIVQGLTVSKRSTPGVEGEAIIMAPLSGPPEGGLDQMPRRWERDGTRPTMAKLVEVGEDLTRAFAIVDDDSLGHAEWHNEKPLAPRVKADDRLVVEWNEMFSMGVSDFHLLGYSKLPWVPIGSDYLS